MKIGTLTIGQSPRTDIIPELKEAIGFKVEIEERGALDDLTLKEVQELFPEPDDRILVTRMADGREVKIAEKYIVHRMKKHLAYFDMIDVDFIILLCTGEFPEDITSKKLFLRPDKLLENIVRNILQDGVLAVILPSPDQISLMEKKWRIVNPNLKIIFEAVSPYTGTGEEINEVAERIAKIDSNLVILDCLGYSKKIKQIFQKVTGKPVLLPRTLLGRMAGELIDR